MVEGTSLLRTAPFSRFNKWDVKRFFINQIKSSYPVIYLEELLIEQTSKLKLSKFPEEEFGILGISNEVGMFDAYTEKGKNINQPYKIIKNDFIAYNPYRVNVGSIGIKKAFLKNTYISNAYVVFSTKENLLADYLYMIMQTASFNKLIRDNTTGSVRQTLSFENLIKIAIPVPPFEEQKSIIQKYNDAISEAERLEKKAEEFENSINIQLLDILFINRNLKSEKSNSFLKFRKLSKCERWDVDYLIGKNTIDYIYTSIYPIVPVKDFVISTQYGSSSKADRNTSNTPVLRMNNIQKGELNISDLKYLSLNDKDLKNYKLHKGDFLFNRTNSKELVGKTAIFDLDGDYVFASYLIRVILDTSKVNTYYVNYLFGSIIVRDQIDLISRQILGQANVNVDEMKDFIIPLPPLSVQAEIVSHINEIKANVKSLRKQASDLRIKAKQDFENTVFN
ncbi:MAG: restriction endonuclease subunit S [Treponema sp.]|nr:restriction endonuclease subunit S [Treponema sp.]